MSHWTVWNNIKKPLRNQGKSEQDANEIAHTWIKKVGLTGFEDAFPNQLSGGMRQRVGTARALACDPEILLMDEPSSALDPLIRYELQSELMPLRKENRHMTVLIVTHDLDEALQLGDRIVIMQKGNIERIGMPHDIVFASASDYVHEFVKNVNRLRLLCKDICSQDYTQEHAQKTLSKSKHTCNGSDALQVVLPILQKQDVDIDVYDTQKNLIGMINHRVLLQALMQL